MGLFGDDDEGQISDAALIAAIRKRLMDEISGGRASDASQIVNNVYGSSPGGGGIVDRLYQSQFGDQDQGQGGDDPYEYYVDIDRTNKYDPEDPSRAIGWEKQVRRYRDKKKA